MKKLTYNNHVLIVFLLFTIFLSDSQVNAQIDTALFSTHYVLPDFVAGSVKMKNGRIEVASMNYNKLTEEMIFDKKGVKMALDSTEAIDTVHIESRIFVPHEKVFYEVLVIGPVSLYMQHKCNLLAAGNPSGYGGTSETGASRNLSSLTNTGRAYKLNLPGDYHVTDASKFWIKSNAIFYKANTGAQIAKAFPEREKEIKEYIKQKKLDLNNTTDLVTLIIKCNELIR
ncbi:MAG: hypothetical protein WCS03_03820 [Bacteroidota bacterium]